MHTVSSDWSRSPVCADCQFSLWLSLYLCDWLYLYLCCNCVMTEGAQYICMTVIDSRCCYLKYYLCFLSVNFWFLVGFMGQAQYCSLFIVGLWPFCLNEFSFSFFPKEGSTSQMGPSCQVLLKWDPFGSIILFRLQFDNLTEINHHV